MPRNRSLIGEAALYGIGQGVVTWGKQLEQRADKAERAYMELSTNTRYRLKNPNKTYKPGMTMVQVRQLFEENPDSGSRPASSNVVSDAVIDAYSDVMTGLEKYKGGKLTLGDFQLIARRYGLNVQERMASDRISVQKLSLALRDQIARRNTINQLLDYKPEIVQQMLDDEVTGPYLQQIFKLEGYPLERQDWGAIEGWIRQKLGQPLYQAPATPQRSPAAQLNQPQTRRKPTEDQIINDANLNPKQKADLLKQYQYISQNEYNQLLKNIQQQQLGAPGATETGLGEQIGTELRQPIPAIPTTGVPSGTQSQLMPAQPVTTAQLPNVFNKLQPANKLKALAYLRDIPQVRNI